MQRYPIKYKSNVSITQRLLEGVCRALSAFILGGIVAYWLVPLAFRQRGYYAIGGEWLVIIAIMLAASEFSARILERRR